MALSFFWRGIPVLAAVKSAKRDASWGGQSCKSFTQNLDYSRNLKNALIRVCSICQICKYIFISYLSIDLSLSLIVLSVSSLDGFLWIYAGPGFPEILSRDGRTSVHLPGNPWLFVQVMWWENMVSRRFKLLGNNESAYHASGRMCQPSQATLIQTATPIEKSHMMASQNGWSKSSKIRWSLYGPHPLLRNSQMKFSWFYLSTPGFGCPSYIALLRLTPSLATQGKLDAACGNWQCHLTLLEAHARQGSTPWKLTYNILQPIENGPIWWVHGWISGK